MIFLIDDNKTRQNDFGWTEARFANFAKLLTPLYTINDVIQIGEKLYSKNNIILYHESFLDFTEDKQKAVEQRSKLFDKAVSNNFLSLAFFSGSQSSRSLVDNIAHMPVALLYHNLEVLVQKHDQNIDNLKYLLFGENPEIEQELDEILTNANLNIENDAAIISGRNLFIRPDLRIIQNAINGAKEVTIYPDVSDDKLSQKVKEWLMQDEYDRIFIPLCFGQTLSDYNGLRLAIHIRCTETPNQLVRIFIYSFVEIEYLLQNEYFNILKTKGVELVNYSKKAFQYSASINISSLKNQELSREIKKLELQHPRNYLDSHSIANEWAIHQWAKTIGSENIDELAKVFQNVQNTLYFKYLRTINPISEIDRISPDQLKINCEDKKKVLLIDDEVERGWYVIFAYLLGSLNGIHTDYLGDNFKNLTQDEIIDKSMQKITGDDFDVVVLDFRLIQNDYINSNPDTVTSIRLLKKIKNFNPGIQVIIFSATNKVWNLQALQNAGADGFIIKEAHINSYDSGFTAKSILNFLNLLREVAKKSILKLFFMQLINVINNLNQCDYEDDSDFEHFLKELKSQIYIIRESGRQIKTYSSITLDVVFLNCYNFLEMLNKYYLKEKDYRFHIGVESVELFRYSFNEKGNALINEGEFVKNGKNDNPSWFQCVVGLLVDYFLVMNKNDTEIKKIWEVKSWRNKYIHENKPHFSMTELLTIAQLLVKATSSIKE